jgi:hypothetical protein
MGGDRREPRLCLKPLAFFVAIYCIDAVGHGNAPDVCNSIS